MFRRSLAFILDSGFLARANIIELAIGWVLVGSLANVLSKLVTGIVMPIIGKLLGGISFTDSFIALSSAVTATKLEDAEKQGAVLAYGDFLTRVIYFLIILASLLLVLRLTRAAANEKKP
jgi:large conductance mechanosensitive channel